MLKRLVLGAVKGAVIGVIIASVLVFALQITATGAALAYALSVATGAVTGLVTGKPIWAPDAKIEAGIKGFVGALLGAGLLFAVRRWLPVSVDLTGFGAGQGLAGELPAVYLPLIAAVLGLFFDADNTAPRDAAPPPRKRVAAAEPDPMLDAELEMKEPESARLRHRQ